MGLFAFVRRIVPLRSEAEAELTLSFLKSLRVAQLESDGYELTRAGRRFVWGPQNGVTGIAPVAALPTTAAQWVIWNKDPQKSLIFDHLGVLLVSGTAAAGVVILVASFVAPAQVGATATGMTIANASNSAVQSKAIFKSAVTVTDPATPIWYVAAKSDSANTGVLSVAAENRDLRARIIVPPQQGLGFVVLSGAGTTPLFAPFGSHVEVETDLE